MSASVSPVGERPFPQGIVLWALVPLAFLLASFTWTHYWDEYLYLYSVRYHSPAALLTLEKGLSDGLFPYGFFTGKIGFVTFVWALVAITGDGPLGLAATRLVFAGLTIGLAAASYQLMRLLTGERQASATALVLLFLPVSLYLGFKTLSEVPSLLLATIACWQFLASFQTESSRATRGHVLVAATALALASLFRFTTVLSFCGLVFALLIVRYDRLPRRTVAARAGVIIGLHLVLAGIIYAVLVGSPIDRFQALIVAVTGRERGLLMKVYALTLTLQLFALPFAVALFRRWTRTTSFAAVWLAVCSVPVLVASSYIEPRYFYMALLPMAMIISTGLCVVSERLGLSGARGSLALLAVLVLGNRVAFAPLMPYEINENEYSRLMRTSEVRHPGSAYLVSWHVDYCYLTFTFPERIIVLTMNRTSGGEGSVFGNREFRWWVGDGRYAGSLEALSHVSRPWVYVGWTYNPTVLALKERLSWLRIGYIERIELDEGLMNHLEQSWIWKHGDLRLREIAKMGRYYGFHVLNASRDTTTRH